MASGAPWPSTTHSFSHLLCVTCCCDGDSKLLPQILLCLGYLRFEGDAACKEVGGAAADRTQTAAFRRACNNQGEFGHFEFQTPASLSLQLLSAPQVECVFATFV
jgi:hypothetical protein